MKVSVLGFGEVGLPPELHAEGRLIDTGYLFSLTELKKLLRGTMHADQVYGTWLSKRREPSS